MLYAGGVLLMMLVGFSLEGLFGGDEEDSDATGSGGASTGSSSLGGEINGSEEYAEDGSGQDTVDPSVYSTDLHDLLFGEEGIGNHGEQSSNGSAASPESVSALTGLDPMEGSDEDDFLSGTAEDDLIDGAGGDDLIYGEEGDDILMGGEGDDTLSGDAGADTLLGGEGDDLLELGSGDLASGGAGADIFDASQSNPNDVPTLVDFESGVDTILVRYDGDTAPAITFDIDSVEENTTVLSDGVPILQLNGITNASIDDVQLQQETPTSPGNDSLSGGEGNETISGGGGNDTIDGFDGNDLLNGGTGDDVLRGRAGMDELFGHSGSDAITGGADNDLISGGSESDLLFGNEGNDTVMGDAGNDEMYGDDGDDEMAGGDGHDLLHGGEGNDAMSGGEGNDLLYGAEGDDTIEGGEGNDYLLGGFGSDEMHGGSGNDTIDGTFAAGDPEFGPFDEDVADNIFGGDGDDHIFLGENDVATGGAGADIFESGTYIETEEAAGTVTDFDPSEDVIQLAIDLTATPNPSVTVVDFEDGTGADVLVNGMVVLSATGAQGLDPNEIVIRDVALDDIAESA